MSTIDLRKLTKITVEDGTVPIGDEEGNLVSSSLVETEDMITSGKTFMVPNGSVMVGANVRLSADCEVPRFSIESYDENYIPVMSLDHLSGSDDPIFFKKIAFVDVLSQPVDTDSIDQATLNFVAVIGPSVDGESGSYINHTIFKGDGKETKGMRITICLDSFGSDNIIWQSHNDVEFNDGGGFTINAAGETTIAPDAAFLTRVDTTLFITYEVNTDFDPSRTISLKGDATADAQGNFSPYTDVRLQRVFHITAATEENLEELLPALKFAHFYEEGNVLNTTINSQNQFEDIDCALAGDGLVGFTISGNTLTYTADKAIKGELSLTVSINPAGDNKDVLLLKAFKNGTVALNGRGKGRSEPLTPLTDVVVDLTLFTFVNLVQDDTIDLKVANGTDDTDMVVQEISGTIKEIR